MDNLLKFPLLLTLILFACSNEADTVNPADIIATYFSNPSGTTLMRTTYTYPADTNTNVALNSNIVLVFSKNVNAGTVAANISINAGGIAYTPSVSNNVVTLDPTPLFIYGAFYIVAVSTGLLAIDGEPLDTALSFTFQASTTNSPSTPIVLTGTRYPANGTVNVSRYLSYVEVTFSKPVTNVTTGTFTIVPAVAGVTVTNPFGNTYRLNMGAPLSYSPPGYTVSLSNLIVDTALPTPNAIAAHSWSFTTETDPNLIGANPTVINNTGIASITDVQAIICFNTDLPVNIAKSYVQYGPTTAYGTNTAETDWDADGQPVHTNHGIILPLLTPNTLYHYRVWIDNDASGTVNAGDITTADSTFYTHTDPAGTVGGKILTNDAGNQNGFKTVQMNDGSSYLFWVDAGTSTIMGQFFNTAGVQQWGAGGIAVTNPGAYTNIFVTKSRYSANNEVLLMYRNGTSINAKMLYNAAGTPAFVWGGPAGGAGNILANDSLTGSNFSAALGHERPVIRTTGIATMPDNGVPSSLFFDKDVDFSTIPWLTSHASDVTQQDHILTNTGGIIWEEYTIQFQTATPIDIYKYLLKATPTFSSPILNLGSYPNYYIVDRETRVSFTASANTSVGGSFPICSASGSPLTGVTTNDIVRVDTDGSGAYRFGIVVSAAPYLIFTDSCVDLDRSVTGLNSGDTFVVYVNTTGPYTSSEAITNPLWDGSKTFIASGVTAGDIVVNENNNLSPATKAVVSSVVSETSLSLDTDIMDNSNNYAIVSLPPGAIYIASGYSTSFANDYRLDDSNANFTGVPVLSGDIVYNIDDDLSAEITNVTATQLTLTADIFNTASNKKYIIYRKRAFILSYIDTVNDVIARKFNLSDGLTVAAATTVETGTFTNPQSVSNGAGDAIVSYESSTGVISVAGVGTTAALRWGPIVKTAAGYALNQIFEISSINSIGGAYILDSNAATGDVNIYRINGSNGSTVGGWPVSVTGFSPHAAIDKYDAALPDRIVLTYLPTHVSGNTYRHVGITAYTGTGALSFAAANVTSNSVAYNCQFPRVVVSDTNTAAENEFYITWFDGRYYSSLGYSLYTQRYASGGTKFVAGNWASEIFIVSPTSFGAGSELLLDTLFYDATTPRGIVPIWLDYRNKAVTSTDIYYGLVKDDGTLP